MLVVIFSRFPTPAAAEFLSYIASVVVDTAAGAAIKADGALSKVGLKRTSRKKAASAKETKTGRKVKHKVSRKGATSDEFAHGALAPVPDSVRVIDTISVHGPKLITIHPADIPKLRAAAPGLSVAPLTFYRRALAPRPGRSRPARSAIQPGVNDAPKTLPDAGTAPAQGGFVITVLNGRTKQPLRDAEVVMQLTNGDTFEGRTNVQGSLTIGAGESEGKARIFVYPIRDCWGTSTGMLTLKKSQRDVTIECDQVNLTHLDGIRERFARVKPGTGAGVKIGIIDTGCDATHPHLEFAGGANLVSGEDELLWRPSNINGAHRTHVAGVIGGRGTPGGLAPGATLMAYRVFPDTGGDATNYDIIKSIDRAVRDGCDILNLSFTHEFGDEAVRGAVVDARNNGVLIIAAAGNNGGMVEYPAAYPYCVAVSACGKVGTFPKSSPDTQDIGKKSTIDSSLFFAKFSASGPDVDACAPGVGVISTVPTGMPSGNKSIDAPYGVMSGTSMSAPVLSAIAARILAADVNLLNASRNAQRRDELMSRLLQVCADAGFPVDLQGAGVPKDIQRKP